jgi:hypothetical protein
MTSGFFTQHAKLPRLAGSNDLFRMMLVRAADRHQIDCLVRKQVIQRRRGARTDPSGHRASDVSDHVGDVPHLEQIAQTAKAGR